MDSILTASVERCARCGASVVQRRANREPNLGGLFWGCSRYPRCRWTQDIGIKPTADPDAIAQRPAPRPPDVLVLGGAVIGIPGGSAQQEYERRSGRDREKRSAKFTQTLVLAIFVAIAVGVAFQVVYKSGGLLIGLIFGAVFLMGRMLPRRSTQAWSIGATGEVETARYLDPLADLGYVVMHDLRRSMSTANIDHVVIGPTGVLVVETKNIKGKLRIDGESMFIGGRRVPVVNEVQKEVRAVRDALGPLLDSKGIGVEAVICAHRADLPWFRRSVAGIPVVYPRQLPHLIRDRDVVLSETDVAELRARAVRLLPPRVARDE